jgi:hypothetical protein
MFLDWTCRTSLSTTVGQIAGGTRFDVRSMCQVYDVYFGQTKQRCVFQSLYVHGYEIMATYCASFL